MSNSPIFHAFDSREAAGEALAATVAPLLKSEKTPSLVVSGGSTPKPFFQALQGLMNDLPATSVLMADERWVPTEHADSNEKLLREHLAHPHINIVSLYENALLEDGATLIEERLQPLPLPFSAVILGMGEDGHTASLFPHHPALSDALNPAQTRRCLPVSNSPKPPSERITLTGPALLNTRALFIHISGEGKRAVLEEAMQPGPVEALPIRYFLQQSAVPVAIYWAA